MKPELLRQCLGEALDTNDLLVLTAEPVDQVRRWLQQAYPSSDGDPEIVPMAEAVNTAVFNGRRWPLVCLLRPNKAGIADKPAFTALLARLRDLHAERVLHIECSYQSSRQNNRSVGLSVNQAWTLADSLALGYTRRDVLMDGSEPLQLFEFELRCYKEAPDWLNSRHWANPELWGKHRW